MTAKNDEKPTGFDGLIRVLSLHAAKYPLMQPEDVVKLVYQNEFGSGHFITDENECLERLKKEAENVRADENIPLSEDIGNGVCRVNLNSREKENISLEKLNAAFIALSGTHKGSVEDFREKLAVVSARFDGFGFGFPEEAFRAYLAEYEKAGYPPVSHSETYRAAYKPAYRLTAYGAAVVHTTVTALSSAGAPAEVSSAVTVSSDDAKGMTSL